ncbi:MAG TPA: Rieske (2Fe-2S) protein [Candidatus Binatia bacterium]|nr:Rieske (2Fe-2S) protein [Candidatus Binatia bacterium]
MSLFAAAALDTIPTDRPLRVELGGTAVALCRVDEAVYACGDVCAHRGASLSEGKLRGTRLACPWHGWMYDVRTGQCTFPGRGAAVPTYPARVEAGHVWVELP